MSDTELINALQKFLDREGALLIHNDGYEKACGCLGLGLKCSGRSLREALALLAENEGSNV